MPNGTTSEQEHRPWEPDQDGTDSIRCVLDPTGAVVETRTMRHLPDGSRWEVSWWPDMTSDIVTRILIDRRRHVLACHDLDGDRFTYQRHQAGACRAVTRLRPDGSQRTWEIATSAGGISSVTDMTTGRCWMGGSWAWSRLELRFWREHPEDAVICIPGPRLHKRTQAEL